VLAPVQASKATSVTTEAAAADIGKSKALGASKEKFHQKQ
jgi:hypothetical protein